MWGGSFSSRTWILLNLLKWGHSKFQWLKMHNILKAMSFYSTRTNFIGHRFTPKSPLKFFIRACSLFLRPFVYWIRTIQGSRLFRRTYCCSHPSIILISWEICTICLQHIAWIASCSLTFKKSKLALDLSSQLHKQSLKMETIYFMWPSWKHIPSKFWSLAQVGRQNLAS